MTKGQKILMWTITILMTALFLVAGLPKLLTPAKMLSQWPYARWFLTFIGVCEVLGALGLLIRPLAALAASGLSLIMIGAVYTLVSHHMANQLPVPVIAFLLLITVIYLRRKEAASSSSAGPRSYASAQ